MTTLAGQADIGAVGAVLLYEDGRLQHAGVALGLGGEAGHRDRKLPADHRGSLQRLTAVHEVSAVTAACLAVERRKYLEVGGFDRAFAVAFNDIDFCLRLQARGYRNLLTPEAVLIHAESASRGQDTGPKRERFDQEASLFRERWRGLVHDDPFYHPLFSTTRFNDLLG
jgi:GT2 family glycosyltransferase